MQEENPDYWGYRYFSEFHNRQEWQSHPLSLKRLHEIQGNQDRHEWFAGKYIAGRSIKRAASFGAGRAETEIALLEMGAVEHFDLYDMSPVGIGHAKERAEQLGFGHRVTCHVGPMQDVGVPENTYDLVLFVASLHHMHPLEPALQIAKRSLRQGGMIWCANEYIGPDRFDYPEEHAAISKTFYRHLPAPLRNKWHEELPRPTPEEVAAVDPTEAPVSSTIEPTMRRMFPDFEMLPLYGSFAFVIFWGLNHDALYETHEGAELVRFILAMDKTVGDSGLLPSYFAHIVVRKPTRWQELAMRLGLDPHGRLTKRAERLEHKWERFVGRMARRWQRLSTGFAA